MIFLCLNLRTWMDRYIGTYLSASLDESLPPTAAAIGMKPSQKQTSCTEKNFGHFGAALPTCYTLRLET